MDISLILHSSILVCFFKQGKYGLFEKKSIFFVFFFFCSKISGFFCQPCEGEEVEEEMKEGSCRIRRRRWKRGRGRVGGLKVLKRKGSTLSPKLAS